MSGQNWLKPKVPNFAGYLETRSPRGKVPNFNVQPQKNHRHSIGIGSCPRTVVDCGSGFEKRSWRGDWEEATNREGNGHLIVGANREPGSRAGRGRITSVWGIHGFRDATAFSAGKVRCVFPTRFQTDSADFWGSRGLEFRLSPRRLERRSFQSFGR
jgi:hypothetical protein